LRCLKLLRAPAPSNLAMPRPADSLTEAQRAALRRFEALYEEWRVADLKLLEAEQKLLAESFRRKGGDVPAELADEVARLRALAHEAHRRALEARDDGNGT
jgi:hypothetical protein